MNKGAALLTGSTPASPSSPLMAKKGSIEPMGKAMQALVTTGRARAIGDSNLNIEQMEDVLRIGG